MKKLYTLIIAISFFASCKAQYVTIPDVSLVNWLQQNYAGCMNGSQLDTTCAAILSATSISPAVDSNMTGLQYFKNVTYLSLSYNQGGLYGVYQLQGKYPPRLTDLEMTYYDVQFMASGLPNTLSRLVLDHGDLEQLPVLPNSITYLQITSTGSTSPLNPYFIKLPQALPPGLDTLIFSGNNSGPGWDTLPQVPNSLKYLDISVSNLLYYSGFSQNYNLVYLNISGLTPLPQGFYLPPLPPNLVHLICMSDNLSSLPALPSTLIELYCRDNALTSLPTLPSGLQILIAGDGFNLGGTGSGNLLTSLPALPNSLQIIKVDNSRITSFPSTANMPGLTTLGCSNNLITSFGAFSNSITSMDLSYNQATSFPAWPTSLNTLYADHNLSTSFPAWPSNLVTLNCYSDSAYSIPALPNSLTGLTCGGKNLDSLPAFNKLEQLICSHSNITHLPALPNQLQDIECTYSGRLTDIPALPSSVYKLFLNNDSSLTCLPLLTSIANLNLTATNVSCLPNYSNVTNSTPALHTIPLCNANSGCPLYWNLSGSVYYDANGDCTHQLVEPNLYPVKMNLYLGANLVQQSIFPGAYSFKTSYGNYSVGIDTTNFPFKIECSGGDSSITVSAADSLVSNVDFETVCGTGYDLGVDYVYTAQYGARPADTTLVQISAGDRMKDEYSVSCNTTGLSGQVVIVITGPAHYAGVTNGTAAPDIISGNTLTWNVADYSQQNPHFNVLVAVDTTAIAGQIINVSTMVTPTASDFNLSNNTAETEVAIVASLDPNNKTVSPVGALTYPYNGWLIYTIHFQNTGNAPAQNIHVTDTLDANVDPSTFELLAYSKAPTVQIAGRYVTFSFPQIDLADSVSNPTASTGYVQYRVKPMANLSPGNTISNTAYIYFDFNAPVVTNTATNSISAATGFKNMVQSNVSIYPNPNTVGNWQLAVSNNLIGAMLQMYTVEGQLVYQSEIRNMKSEITAAYLSAGIYFIRISTGNEVQTVKVVKE